MRIAYLGTLLPFAVLDPHRIGLARGRRLSERRSYNPRPSVTSDAVILTPADLDALVAYLATLR
jgi:hypothetical protein